MSKEITQDPPKDPTALVQKKHRPKSAPGALLQPAGSEAGSQYHAQQHHIEGDLIPIR
jgi:hypothetical protein